MAVTSQNSGTQTAVVNTEHTLDTVDGAGVYVFIADTAAMVNGDTVELRIYGKVLSAGTERMIYSSSFQHQQADPIKLSPPVPTDLADLRFTLKQVAGTARNFPWKTLSL